MATRRAKGTGSVRKVGNAYYWRITINGKKIVKRLDASNDQEADLEATRLYTIASAKTQEEVALFAGRARKIINLGKTIPLKKAFEAFTKSPVRPETIEKTLKQHEYHWNIFLEWLPVTAINIEDITSQIDLFFGDMAEEKKPRTFNCILKSLKLIFRIVYPAHENPCRFIKKRDENTESKKELTEKQQNKVFNAVDKDYPFSIMHRKDVKILFRVGAYTGMRLKDCVLVKWSDINFTRNTINVKPYKTNKHITVPMHPDLLAVLKSANKKNEYVMPDLADRYFRNPSGVDKTSCRVIWYALESKHVPGKLPDRIKGYGFHSLRHSFVSFCANAGVPLAVVQEIVGHNNVAVTRIYAHFAPETLRQAIDALPGRKSAPMRPEKKLKQIKELLDGGKLTAREKKILEVLGK